jgi:hypothetical protein
MEIDMKRFITSLCVASLVLVAASPLFAGRPGSRGSSGSSGSVRTTSNHTPHTGTTTTTSSSVRSVSPTKFTNANPVSHDYHTRNGRSFSHGFFYSGRNHYHWSYYTWWSRFNCYVYWCPSSSCYYYWCETANCYYPVSYAETAAPTANAPLLQIVNNNNNNVATSGSPTPVAGTPLPVGSELPPPPSE